MKDSEIKNTIEQARGLYGSSNPTLLWEIIEKLLLIITFLQERMSRKNDELAYLRNKVFGSSSEKSRRLNDNDQPQEDAPSDALNVSEAKESDKPSIPSSISSEEEIKKLRAEARRLAREMKNARPSHADNTSNPCNEAEIEKVRRRIPETMDVICPLCNKPIADQGVSSHAKEIDLAESLFVEREYLLHKGSCPCGCLRIVMPPPVRGVEGTNYSPRFVAKLIYDKFFQCLPAYRQSMGLAAMGLKIHRNTILRLLTRAHLTLLPVIEAIREESRKQTYRQCDESVITTVIDKKKKKQYLWCLLSDKAIAFTVTPTRNKQDARRIVGDTKGVLTTDRLNIYRDLVTGLESSGCLAHCRRLFWYSLPTYPNESIAIIRLIGKLYQIEREATLEKSDHNRRKELREARSLPLLEEIRSLLSSMTPSPKSNLQDAIDYFSDHWKALTYFCKDGRVPIDNNGTENALRLPKLGFKNFLFAQSELGAEIVAGYYTLIATCKLYQINPVIYLADVLLKLNSGHKMDNLSELLPWNWQATKQPSEKVSANPVIREEKLEGGKVIQLTRVIAKISKLVKQA